MPNQREKLSRLCLVFCGVLTLALCYRWQRIFYLMCADYILSDMPAHIRLALGRNDYSLASLIVRGLWGLLGESRGQTALSLILTATRRRKRALSCWLRCWPISADPGFFRVRRRCISASTTAISTTT